MVFFGPRTRKVRPIGLDIGHDSLKMLQLKVENGRVTVLAAEKVRFDPSLNGDAEARRQRVISAIRQMLGKRTFRGRNVVSCLPSEAVRITSLRLAETEPEGIERALHKEVAQRFGFGPDEGVVNYIVAGSVRHAEETKNELIVFAAGHETIRAHIEMLEEAGLRPVSIDVIPCALFRSFERLMRRQEDKERTVVLVDVGARFTTVVFGRGGQITFIKQIPVGGNRFRGEVASRLAVGIDKAEQLREVLRREKGCAIRRSAGGEKACDADGGPLDPTTKSVVVDAITAVAEELAREVSLCLRYYTVTFRGKRIGKAIVSGGEAYEGILMNVLRRHLAVQVEIAEPLRGFDLSAGGGRLNFDSDRRGLLCEWAVAVGLGLKGSNWLMTSEQTGESHEGN